MLMLLPFRRKAASVLICVAAVVLVAAGDATLAQQSATRAEFDVIRVAPKVHMITGDGGNIAVQAGPEGTIVVDSGAGQRSKEVLAAIQQLSEAPIRYILNTS